MKIITLVIAIVIGSVSWAWADDPVMAAIIPIATQATLTGIVKSVSWADPAKGTKSEIVVKYSQGKIIKILVTPTTTVWDADIKAIMPDKIAAKSRVNVIYTTSPEGLNVGKSIKILK